jgi:hypothetical protein
MFKEIKKFFKGLVGLIRMQRKMQAMADMYDPCESSWFDKKIGTEVIG